MTSPSPFQILHSMSADRSAIDKKLNKATRRRVLAFSQPYRTDITFFIATIVVSTFLGLLPPLLVRAMLDGAIADGDTGHGGLTAGDHGGAGGVLAGDWQFHAMAASYASVGGRVDALHLEDNGALSDMWQPFPTEAGQGYNVFYEVSCAAGGLHRSSVAHIPRR